MSKDRLKSLLVELVGCKDLQPKVLPDGEQITSCNFALLRMAVYFGCKDFASVPNANAIHRLVSHASDWLPASGLEAHNWANKGMFAIAAKTAEGHGHVATVYPADAMYHSGSLDKDVPWLANVGKRNGILPQSQCFSVKEKEPEFYLWTGCSGY